jgi:hypothetical protein
VHRIGISLSIITSQLLLIALSLAWGIHSALIIRNGAAYFVEPNGLILYYEIISTAVIALYGITTMIFYFFNYRSFLRSTS